jgi:Mg-chelatase subunit ChlD
MEETNKQIKEDNIEKAKQTEIVVVLDRSGSMGSISKSTVDGFNTFLNEQQNAEGEAFMTLVQFDDRYEIDYKSVPVKDVNPLIDGETFKPRGMTALLDAIGKTVNELETDRDVVFVIITDGGENSSREYKRDAIMNIIKTLEDEKGWYFLFLGANQDAIAAGGGMGIGGNKSFTFNATDDGTSSAFASFSSNISNYRSSKMEYAAMNMDKNITINDLQNLKMNLDFSDDQRKDQDKK